MINKSNLHEKKLYTNQEEKHDVPSEEMAGH